MMKTKKLGWTDLEISALGLGTAHINNGKWRTRNVPHNDDESITIILKALEKGINWIDTAPLYCRGYSEEVLAQVFKQRREHPIIITKCGRLWDKNGRLYSSLKPASIRNEIEASLRRLRINEIDLYLVHWPEPENEIEEAWETIAELIKEGKVRYGGVSNFNIGQLQNIHAHHPIAVIQQPYNMLNRAVQKDVMQFCHDNNIGFMAYSPLQKGLLTGKYTKEYIETLPEDDNRKFNPDFNDPILSRNLSFIEKLRQLSNKIGITVAQLALSWVLKRTEVTGTIIGTKNLTQLEELVASEKLIIPMELMSTIDDLLQMFF